MTIRAEFALQRCDFRLEAAFELPLRGVTAIFGPSGCGKTTLLRAIAGLETCPGSLQVGEQVFQQGQSFVAPEQRRIGYVFQEASLFEHLSVRKNLLYGWKRLAVSERRVTLDEVVNWLGLADLLEHAPAQLSGGQRQRVAIGRALLASPRLLLMDEPLAALDRTAKRQIMPYLERLADESGVPVFFVTHAAEEVERLADRVIFMRDGRIDAVEELQQALSRPDSPLFSEEGAASIIDGAVGKTLPDGRTPFYFNDLCLWLVRPVSGPVPQARLRIKASDISLARVIPEQISIVNHLRLRISGLHSEANGRLLVLGELDNGQPLAAEVSHYSGSQLDLQVGDQVYALIKAVALLA